MPEIRTNSSVSRKMVADHLSVATVSKALSNKSDVSEAMRIKVERAANELGYKFGATQHRRRTQDVQAHSRFLGAFLRRSIENGGKNVPTYLDGVSRTASDLNAALVVQEWRYADDPVTQIRKQHQPPVLRDGLFAGLALGGEWPAEVINTIRLRQPVVLFPQSVWGTDVDVVGIDNVATMLQIVDRLKTSGHRRIGFVGCCGAMARASCRSAALQPLGGTARSGYERQASTAISGSRSPGTVITTGQTTRKAASRLPAGRRRCFGVANSISPGLQTSRRTRMRCGSVGTLLVAMCPFPWSTLTTPGWMAARSWPAAI